MDKEQTLNQILDYLNKVKTRTTYGVVAELLGVIPQSVGQHLGEKRPEVSWVVNGTTKEPTGYSEADTISSLPILGKLTIEVPWANSLRTFGVVSARCLT